MKTTAIISIAQLLVKALERRQIRKEASRQRRAQLKADRRRDADETAAWLADWQCDKLNAALRDRIKYDPTITHHEGANPTTRIDLTKHKPIKPTKDGRK